MAIATSNISLQAIQAEVGHGTSSNISLQAQSQNAANTGHTSTISGYSSPGGGLTGSPYGIGEFGGYVNLSIGSFPAFSQGYASDPGMTGSLSSTAFNGYQTHFNTAFGQQAGAFAVVGFRHTPSNGYVTMEFYSGTNASAATVYYQKIPYTGLSNATWSVKYEYPNTSSAIGTYEQYANETTYDEAKHPATSGGGSRNEGTYYQLSTGGTGNSFFMQFPWIATANYRNSPQSDNAQARVGTTPISVQFTLKATQGGTDYTVTSSSFTIELHAQRGAFLP